MSDPCHAGRPAGARAALLVAALCLATARSSDAAAAAAVATEPASCQRTAVAASSYLRADPTGLIGLLGPPAAAASPAEAAELAVVLATQRAARGTPRRAQAIADSQGSCARFADALGASSGEVAAPALAFLDRAALQASAWTGAAKRHFQRARPFVREAAVERLADVAPDLPLPPGAAPGYFAQRDHTSYPSGHATLGAACAILMAAMVPERSAELFARGREYGESRLVVGAHFPGDVEAGRIAATVAVALMRQDSCFREDEATARRELRAALALPP